jgi:hypothetical protein
VEEKQKAVAASRILTNSYLSDNTPRQNSLPNDNIEPSTTSPAKPPQKMVLQLLPASPSDADRIATIHLEAFDDNPLLHAQFPTPASLKALLLIISGETLHAIQNAQDAKAIFVVKDTELERDGQIIAFAKWDLPTETKTELHEGVTWPEDCQQEWLERYHELAEAAKERVIGNAKCYRESFRPCSLLVEDFAFFRYHVASSVMTQLTLVRPDVRWHAAETSRAWSWDHVE